MNHDYDAAPASGGDSFESALDAVLSEIDAGGLEGIETKSAVRPQLRRAASESTGDTQRAAIVAIGKEVLAQGRKIDGFIAKHSLTPKSAHDLSRRAFERFKEANDLRLKEVRRRGAADTLSDLKLDRANRELDRIALVEKRMRLLEVKGNRPHAMGSRSMAGLPAGAGARKLAQQKFRQAVIHYMKTGQEYFDGEHLNDIQKKSLHTELNPEGGYLVMPEHEKSPLRTFLTELSTMRQRATVREISTSELVQPRRTAGAAAGWVAERGARPETASPTLGLDKYATMELYAMPGATQTMLDDAIIDIEAWLAEEIAEAMALQESDAWFNGNGITQPRGLLTYDFAAPASWAHGKFRFLVTGAAAGFASSNPADALINVIHELKPAYRQNASWLLTRATIGEVRKFKDTTGQYLWQPSLVAGQPPTLLSYGVDEDEFMVDLGSGTFPVGFGDWRRTYIIVDRIGVRVLRDQYTNKPFILFYTTKRVGGGVQNFDAAVFLKCST